MQKKDLKTLTSLKLKQIIIKNQKVFIAEDITHPRIH